MLPNGWRQKTVGELFDIQLGKMLNQAAKENNEQYPYLTNFNVQWGYFELSNLNTMHFSSKERKKFSLRPNDLITTK